MQSARETHFEFVQVTTENKNVLGNAIYHIYMQPHVLPYMSFDQMDADQFNALFADFMAERDIFVLKANGDIVATISMELHGYTAEIVSFAVDAKHLRKGYGKQCYIECEKLLKTNGKYASILRVEQSQETDNPPALHLAVSRQYKEEAVFLDWLQPIAKSAKTWLHGERFLSTFTEAGKKIAQQSKSIFTEKGFKPQLPSLLNEKNNSEKQALRHDVITLKKGIRRFDHIQFCSITIENDVAIEQLKSALRALIVKSASEGYKKFEIFSANATVVEILRDLGFHYRGEKIASCKIGDQYYNELGADFGFFNIADAEKIIAKSTSLNPLQRAAFSSALTMCQEAIQQSFTNQKIDAYAKLYLENLAFQMTRECLVEKFYHGNDEYHLSPWNTLIAKLPEQLNHAFVKLSDISTLEINNNPASLTNTSQALFNPANDAQADFNKENKSSFAVSKPS